MVGSDFLPLTSKFVSEGRGNGSRPASRGHEPDYTEIRFQRTEFSMEEDEEAANLDTVEGDVDKKAWLCDVPMVLEARDEGRSKVPYLVRFCFHSSDMILTGGLIPSSRPAMIPLSRRKLSISVPKARLHHTGQKQRLLMS